MSEPRRNASVKVDKLSTDYIVKLLEKDAKNLSKKLYVSSDTEPSTRESSGLKPNTRFLKTLIQQSDSHNKALLEKEQELAQQKLHDSQYNKHKRQKDVGRSKKQHISGSNEDYLMKHKSQRISGYDDDESSSRKRRSETSENGREGVNSAEDTRGRKKQKGLDKIQNRITGSGTNRTRPNHSSHSQRVKIVHQAYEEDEEEEEELLTDWNSHKNKKTSNSILHSTQKSIETGPEDRREAVMVKKGRGFTSKSAIDEHGNPSSASVNVKQSLNHSKLLTSNSESKRLLDSINSRLQWSSKSSESTQTKREPLRKATPRELKEYYRKQEEFNWDDYSKPGTSREWDKSKIVDKNGFIQPSSRAPKWK